MRNDLPPDIVAQLARRHQDDLRRIRAMHASVEHFEHQPLPCQRFGFAFVCSLVTLIVYAVGIVTFSAYLLGRVL